jgi:hypothetical protein
MPKRDSPGPSLVTDTLPSAMARMLATAIAEITEHSNDHGHCAVCEMPFPCPRAELAAFTLDAV